MLQSIMEVYRESVRYHGLVFSDMQFELWDQTSACLCKLYPVTGGLNF